jgi:Zn-dependent metalloprotease
LTATSQFADLAYATATVAEKFFGVGSNDAMVVKKAWKDVGL